MGRGVGFSISMGHKSKGEQRGRRGESDFRVSLSATKRSMI